MQNLDNHMDELFQKAAADYPLKTEPGNFDDLVPFIAGESTATVTPVTKKGKRKTTLLLLAFLFTGGIIGTYLISNYNGTSVKKETIPLLSNEMTENKTALTIHTDVPVNNETPLSDVNAPAPDHSLTGSESNIKRSNAMGLRNARFAAKVTQGEAIAEAEEKTNETVVIFEPGLVKTTVTVPDKEMLKNEDRVTGPEKESSKIAAIQETELQVETPQPKIENDKKKTFKPKLYYGAIAGAELNQVKSQGMTKPGFNGGILLGLQVSKKVSVETGVQLAQKKYYSEGKYFHPKSGSMPSNMKIMSLDGSCTVIEIPVSVKYNFSKKENTVYGKAGISSYIMTKEKNNYQAMVSGQEQEINSTYKKSTGYAAAEVRISAGYQQKLSKKIDIRVEPYVQIPLKGIGIGVMPVTSTGLQLVLTRN